MHRLRSAGPLAGLIAALFFSPAAQAALKIGDATLVQRDVTGALPGRERKVAQGDDVFVDELIRTAQASAAKILFVDKTNLAIGPQAAVKLDRFVFKDDRSAKAMAVTVTKGAMRWVSGISPSSAYQIKTPNAIIGVRGTIFDVLVAGGRTSVVLQEGSVEVCTMGPRRRCRTLSRKGDMIEVTGSALHGPRPGGPGASDFASRCLSAASQRCIVTASADQPTPQAKQRAAKAPEAEPPRPRLRTKLVRNDSPPRRRVVMADPIVEEAILPVRRYPVGLYRPWPDYDRPIRGRPPRIDRVPAYPSGMGRRGGWPNRGMQGGWGGGRGVGMRMGAFGGGMEGRGFGGYLR
jgi:hypothetical protein